MPTYPFRSDFAESIFYKKKYAKPELGIKTWKDLAHTLVNEVCMKKKEYLLSQTDREELQQQIYHMKIIPGGRYLYYAGREANFYSNCYLLSALEDTREDWASLAWRVETCLMLGGGVGVNYDVYRPAGTKLKKTGGIASGPLAALHINNEIGRYVKQGGSRRSALFGSLSWTHADIMTFMQSKDWHKIYVPGTDLTLAQVKAIDSTFEAPLDCTNISPSYDTKWLEKAQMQVAIDKPFRNSDLHTFWFNVYQALTTGEPGFIFNFYQNEALKLRNACGEVIGEEDSEQCNLTTLNFSRIATLSELVTATELAIKFLLCGSITGDSPYAKVAMIKEKNRLLGLEITGIHEWLLQKGYPYEVVPELRNWLQYFKEISIKTVKEIANKLSIATPIRIRALGPTGTLSILADTTSGIEPLFASAYERKVLLNDKWETELIIDHTAQELVKLGISSDSIETAFDLSNTLGGVERRLKFQADIQDYIDNAISSTINLSTILENKDKDKVEDYCKLIVKYAPRLKGLTFYPNGARGGQILTPVNYEKAVKAKAKKEVTDICVLSRKSTC